MIIKKYNWLLILLLLFYSCENSESNDQSPSGDENNRTITILYTNDEHGWIEASDYSDGAAKMMGLWRAIEGYNGDDSYLILSGGDNWTGPAISTWFEGESMVEVMNAMEYDAAAIGNHEFDFKVDNLYDRIAQANFPYLSANIRNKSNGESPDFATPYIIAEINDISVGIIGLTTISAPLTTFPDNVVDYDFINYSSALNEVVPLAKADGAELLIVIAHICYSEIIGLTDTLHNLGISVIGGGHCHDGLIGQTFSSGDNQIAVLKSESFMQNYAKVEITYDIIEKKIISMDVGGHQNENGTADPAVASAVSVWRTKTDTELSEVIGYVENEILRDSNEMYNMVTDSWLFKYPNADIVMTNAGGIRQSIPAGEITKEVIIGVLPFQNNIVELQLSGSQVIASAQYNDLIFSGMTTIGGYFLTDGSEIDDDANYSVLTTDYLYVRADQPFSQYDPNPYYTSLNYHQPTIDWITSKNTSVSNSLDSHLTGDARR